jgi:anti-sigma regulatory factor (Ser/Thr protein kinase)
MRAASSSPHRHGHGFRHEALLYAGDDGFVDATLPFVRDAVEAGEPIMVAVAPSKIDRLSRALNGGSERVRFVDMEALGGNPARIIPAWREFVDENASAGRALRGIGEPVWPARSDEEIAECHRHESLLNVAFADAEDFWLMCPYDTEGLGSAVVGDACRTHPVVVEDGIERTSRDYSGGAAFTPFTESLGDAPASLDETPFEALTLNEVRRRVVDEARSAGLDPIRAEEFQLAVSEIAANSVRHAGGAGVLRVWSEAESVVAEVRDPGHIADPLAGRRRPEIDQVGGYGLWIANQLCDLVQIRSFVDGNVVRLRMRRPALAAVRSA